MKLDYNHDVTAIDTSAATEVMGGAPGGRKDEEIEERGFDETSGAEGRGWGCIWLAGWTGSGGRTETAAENNNEI